MKQEKLNLHQKPVRENNWMCWHLQPMPIVRIKPTCLSKFSGNYGDFNNWKSDWENLQRQGEPNGSAEVMIQLVDSIDDKSAKALGLSSYNTTDNAFRVLENRYGNKSTIPVEIGEETSQED